MAAGSPHLAISSHCFFTDAGFSFRIRFSRRYATYSSHLFRNETVNGAGKETPLGAVFVLFLVSDFSVSDFCPLTVALQPALHDSFSRCRATRKRVCSREISSLSILRDESVTLLLPARVTSAIPIPSSS